MSVKVCVSVCGRAKGEAEVVTPRVCPALVRASQRVGSCWAREGETKMFTEPHPASLRREGRRVGAVVGSGREERRSWREKRKARCLVSREPRV